MRLVPPLSMLPSTTTHRVLLDLRSHSPCKQEKSAAARSDCRQMKPQELTRCSRFISRALRHEPALLGISLDPEGWASVTDLLKGLKASGFPINRIMLHAIVKEDKKGRYSLSPDKRKIRANHGHSVEVNLGLEPRLPPTLLYHGTARANIQSIKKQGIRRQERLYVHLSPDEETAMNVGRRHGHAVVLPVRAALMNSQGFRYFRSDTGIWLTKEVPASFIDWDGMIFDLR